MMRELVTFHTYAKILSSLNDGDSLTDIQRKTGLSYPTVSNSINKLELMGVIRTKEEFTQHGKVRECFTLKPSKDQSYAFLNEIKKYKDYLDGNQTV